jgi:two-component system chemotaxis response regulator CheB
MSMIRVVVVDDSALVRSLLTAMINAQSDMQVVGSAADPYQAREMIRNLNPDVITLDIEMPRMDGLDFLEKLMRLRPMPVVMVSTLTERGAEVTLRALELGAVEFVTKPRLGINQGLTAASQEITEKIRIASRAQVARRLAVASPGPAFNKLPVQDGATASGEAAQAVLSRPGTSGRLPGARRGTELLIAVGSSTGGTEAIRCVLEGLPADSPAMVITQHMPAGFTLSFAQRLDRLCAMRVKEADDGERLLPGHAYIAPGGRHLKVIRSGADYRIRLDDGEPVNRHRPSVDVMFKTVAEVVGPNAIGVMLTGMGRDGADAMRLMKDAGAYNLAQDEATCVVYGMPREAVLAGAVDEVLPLQKIAGRLIERIRHAGPVLNRV